MTGEKQTQGQFRFKSKPGDSVKKPVRKVSVRKLEDFDAVRQHFIRLTMSGTSEADNTGQGIQQGKSSRDAIIALLLEREKPVRLLKTFANVTVVSRQMLAGLQNKVALYVQLKDLDTKLDLLHSEWLDSCGITAEELENRNDELKPSLIVSKFEESGNVLDLVEAAFKQIKEKYSDKQAVIDYLDFIDKPLDNVNVREQSPSKSSSTSVHSGKGEEYVKAKLPKLKEEVDLKFKKIKDKFDTTMDLSEHQLNQLVKQLEDLMSKIDDKSPFESLMKDAYDFPTFDRTTIVGYEEWQQVSKGLIESLISSISDKIETLLVRKAEEATSQSVKQSYNTFLKKQDPPKFKGDCLDFLEFKRKWLSQVSTHKPPSEYELDLLKKSIPDEGKKKLYGVDSISTAWNQLEKMYGDKGLICQKLKSRLKNLKPASTEAHEVIIELHNEIEYLVKRLKDFNAVNLLYFDNEYLNSCYKHLPAIFQHEWDKYETEEFEHDWIAFMEFMSVNAKAAMKKRARVESLKELVDHTKEKKGSKAVIAAVDSSKAESSSFNSSATQELNDKQRDKYLSLQRKAGDCKLCKEMHTFQSRWMKSSLPSDRFLNCPKFKNMSAKARGETLQKNSACVRCTSWLHKREECKSPQVSCKEQVDGSECGKDHSRLVCQSGVAYCTNLAVKTAVNSESSRIDENIPTIPYLQDVTVESKGRRSNARAIWDNGSNRLLVNNDFAAENNMTPISATVIMKTVGGVDNKLDVKIYEFSLVSRNGMLFKVWGYGIDSIIEPDDPVDPSCVRTLFPHIPSEVFMKLEKRRIDILIGINYNGLFPVGGSGKNCQGNLKVLKTQFGTTGWILGGSHEKLQYTSPRFSSGAVDIMTAARLRYIPDIVTENISEEVDRKVTALKVITQPMLTPEFWEKDSLGVLPPRRCQKCRQCSLKGECSEKHLLHTLEEEEDLRAIENNIDIIDGVTVVKYPFKRDPSCLPFNRSTAVNIASKLWNSLKKDNLLEAYNTEIRKYIDRGTFLVLTKQEMDDYAGPAQYITHHGVLKDSVSTPLRVVTNSSFKNGKYSLNDLLPKGPNSLNDMLEVTVRFRAYEKVFGYDLSKAYNTMRTTLVERHLRRFIWRFSEDEPWLDLAIDRVHFGDKPAACQLEVSKRKIAKLGESIDPIASAKLIEDSYVDDGFSGGTEEEISRMVGSQDKLGNYNGTLSQILALGGYQVKEFVIEGDLQQSEENLLGNSVFGYSWNPKGENMKLVISLNLSKKKRSVRVLPALKKEDLDGLASMHMSKRNLLGLTNSFGDFLGMSEPFTLRFKLLMKSLFERETPLLWDDPISSQEKSAWIQLIREAVFSGEHVFPRKTRPDHSIGGPRVVGFGDGAFPAFGGCAYIVWEHSCPSVGDCRVDSCKGADGGHYSAYLTIAKARVTPLSGLTIPRSEISGGVVVSRLVLRVVTALQSLDSKPVSCVILLDSECTISTLEASSSLLKPYFHNRRSEILENMESVSKFCIMEPVHWVSSSDNPADLLTRGTAKLDDIGLSSTWQVGPKFLSLPRERWPVDRDCVINKSERIPKDEMRSPISYLRVALAQVCKGIDISLFSSMESVLNCSNDLQSRIRVVARLIKAWSATSKDQAKNLIKQELSRTDLERAERFILLFGMIQTATAHENGELISLMPFRSGKLIVTRGRLGEAALEPLLGVSELPILMPHSRVAELYMWRAHKGHSNLLHRSVSETLSRSRSSVWIVKGKQLAKKICNSCMECRRERKALLSQQMAELRTESSSICPPWTHISLDYAGPIVMKGEINTRSRGKGWILIYVCRSTKAVCLLPTAGYDTASFLIRHKEFIARKGQPRSVVSDRGTQLVKSGIILAEKNSPKGWDWASVVRANSASDWQFVPVGAQHRNGLAEATVKVLKQSLKHAIAPGVTLSYSELNTLLAEISFTINCRPLGLRNVSGESNQEDFLSPLTPNQLLLGRTDDNGPVLDYVADDRFTQRLAYVTQVYNCWWEKWIRQVLPTLMPLKRWKAVKRNLQKDDVVMMLYPGNLKNDYRLARVVKVYPDSKGLVRTVDVVYRKKDVREKKDEYRSKPLTREQVSVQRLSLLVREKETDTT